MDTFSATVTSDQTIEVRSNTYWSCKAEGNFMLSTYDGTGNESIIINIPEDVMVAQGVVTFSYGDELCKYPEVGVFMNNDCYIHTIPGYKECKKPIDEEDEEHQEDEVIEKTIYFYYNEPRETFNVTVQCFDGWSVDTTDFDYITNNNDVMIISSGRDGELRIIPTHQCGGRSIIHVKLVKRDNG